MLSCIWKTSVSAGGASSINSAKSDRKDHFLSSKIAKYFIQATEGQLQFLPPKPPPEIGWKRELGKPWWCRPGVPSNQEQVLVVPH